MRSVYSGWLFGGAVLAMVSCERTPPAPAVVDLIACEQSTDGLRLNEIQSIGSHNSYKMAIPAVELAMIALGSPEAAASLDYAHLPLVEQLQFGMRQLELDVYYDPEGGRYSDPLLPRLSANTAGAERYDATGMEVAGFKVLHVQDVDMRSHCARFVQCLEQIDTWSRQNPEHVPLLILINAKQDNLDLQGSTEALPFDVAAFEQLDAEIFSTLGRTRLILPDDVRGGAATLRQAVTGEGWPELAASRGKILFALDESAETVATYIAQTSSLEGRAMFVNSLSETAAHAAYFTRNEPLAAGVDIPALVNQGFLVRTRADADTLEAREGRTERREAALASGAQYVSTDYYKPRAEFSDYAVTLRDGAVSRCNGVQR